MEKTKLVLSLCIAAVGLFANEVRADSQKINVLMIDG